MVHPYDANDRPNVPVKPPIMLAALLMAGVGMEFVWPAFGGMFLWGADGLLIGVVLVVVGVLIASTAMRSFIAAGTTVLPDKPNTAFVKGGVYKYSRNPMYIGLILIYLGLAAALGSVWALVLAPLFIAYLRYFAVSREEAYLKRRFGEPYIAYMRRVPRWF
ncbi:MAG: isoprenylcysteine carboxylmethyltransferase family protein [Hyphomicrobiales bacterium]|nr:isoprenylcysteine carboxylmethyltransferase family protein [Hyphomicrobiales bacterium]